MKKFLLLFLLLSASSFAQNGILLKNDGTKLNIEDNSINFRLVDRRVDYRQTGKKSSESVKYKDLDYVLFNGFKFKPMKLKKGKFTAYFILAESNDKKLVGVGTTGSMSYYELIVIDNNNNILEFTDFMITNTKKHRTARMSVGPMVKKYFPDCTELLERLSLYEFPPELDKKSTKILGFIETPTYVKCE